MEAKSLVYGIIGFLAGGLLVSIVAVTTTPKPTEKPEMAMNMSDDLDHKRGDKYDEAFIQNMIDHHQGAIDMAKMSAEQAQHQEIKDLSNAIIEAQEKEIADMKKLQETWGHEGKTSDDDSH